jgi:hypothetical protein
VSPDKRDNLLQEIFLKAWKELPALRQACSFKSWLYRIATQEHSGKATFCDGTYDTPPKLFVEEEPAETTP